MYTVAWKAQAKKNAFIAKSTKQSSWLVHGYVGPCGLKDQAHSTAEPESQNYRNIQVGKDL